MTGRTRAQSTGCREVARQHGRLQRTLAELREFVDEPTEASTNAVAAEALDVLRRLTVAAEHVRRRAEQTSGGTLAAGDEMEIHR
ncbi:hypothetical protein [Pseudonocardia sp.]|uniref:hypothetical protein n=1 Tax=Pseudonocardia sp. TaxID=60912 RepID=UPI00261A1B6D|nr:hypothetical protein [Pseudonocardia sp.]